MRGARAVPCQRRRCAEKWLGQRPSDMRSAGSESHGPGASEPGSVRAADRAPQSPGVSEPSDTRPASSAHAPRRANPTSKRPASGLGAQDPGTGEPNQQRPPAGSAPQGPGVSELGNVRSAGSAPHWPGPEPVRSAPHGTRVRLLTGPGSGSSRDPGQAPHGTRVSALGGGHGRHRPSRGDLKACSPPVGRPEPGG
jgi:hypothetical protein